MESRLRMAAPIQPQHDLSPIEIDEIEQWIYNYNRRAIGRNDARGLGFVIRDEAGRTIAVAAGYSWAGTSELKQMWVDEAYRGRGYARELLNVSSLMLLIGAFGGSGWRAMTSKRRGCMKRPASSVWLSLRGGP